MGGLLRGGAKGMLPPSKIIGGGGGGGGLVTLPPPPLPSPMRSFLKVLYDVHRKKEN